MRDMSYAFMQFTHLDHSTSATFISSDMTVGIYSNRY
jgi:hypothetical protein